MANAIVIASAHRPSPSLVPSPFALRRLLGCATGERVNFCFARQQANARWSAHAAGQKGVEDTALGAERGEREEGRALGAHEEDEAVGIVNDRLRATVVEDCWQFSTTAAGSLSDSDFRAVFVDTTQRHRLKGCK